MGAQIPDDGDPLPRPFSFEFHSTASPRSADVDATVQRLANAQLRSETASRLRGMTDNHARTYLVDLADAAEHDTLGLAPSGYAEQLRATASNLAASRSGCRLSTDAWYREYPTLEGHLRTLGGQLWALKAVCDPLPPSGRSVHVLEDVLDGSVNLRTLWDRVLISIAPGGTYPPGSHLVGWEDLTVSWDGHKLLVVFSAGDKWSVRLGATPLDSAQRRLWRRWRRADQDRTDIASVLLESRLGDVALALDLWDAIEQQLNHRRCEWDFDAVLYASSQHREVAGRPEFALAAASMSASWTGTMDELFLAAAAVVAPAGSARPPHAV